MASNKGKVAVGEVACLHEQVVKEPKLEMPEPNGGGPEGNKSSAGGHSGESKSNKAGNRRKRNKGRS